MEYWGKSRNEGYDGRTAYQELPICCIALIGINVMIFLVGILVPQLGSIMREKGQFGVLYLMYGGEFYRLITSAFLHSDAAHLCNNMLLLYFCGDVVEKSLGRWKFLLLYFLSAVFGDLLSAAFEFSTGGYYNSIGASGAVFGLTGAMLFLVIIKKGTAANISMKRALIAVALSLYAGFSDVGVNNAAHVGGLLSGFIFAFLLSMIPTREKRRNKNEKR
ncbi:MAG: rhomboid family intramembrane serine protease [Lachnospiraceae bacterium]|nr:rhomboid family intramembrane serine protease [Lachnospiraceae bacterium]